MKAKSILKNLNYLPRWAWYLVSFLVVGLIGPLIVYLIFHVLEKRAGEEEEQSGAYGQNEELNSKGAYAHRGQSGKGTASSGYRDEDCIVTGEDDEAVLREWARTEESARQARSARQQGAPSDDKETQSEGSGDHDDVVREVHDAMRRIRHANSLIPDTALSAQIESIENSCGQILAILQQRPQLLRELRTFLRYYLPTTLKLLDARARLENTANTPKAREVRTRISEALGVIDTAFKKQVEALDEYRFIDLESEIDVLSDMLRADGFVEEDKKQDDDPFADALRKRSEKKGGTQTAPH